MPGADSRVESLVELLDRYGLSPADARATPLGAAGGGFSGAQLWRISAGDKQYCLRRWPAEHPSRERLQFIHAVLRHVAAKGFEIVPVPQRDMIGQSAIEWRGTFWELTPWLPGSADYQSAPSPTKLAAAMSALANFHLAAATFSHSFTAPSPGLIERNSQLQSLREWECAQLVSAIQPADWPELFEVARPFTQLLTAAIQRVSPQVAASARWPVPLQPCIRDIWSDHVLFTGEDVTGVVDFGAMRPDSVAGDVARLMGSLVEDDALQRSAALAAYNSIRPLSSVERRLVDVFDQSTVVLGGIHWLRWIYVEHRFFPDRRRVVDRLRMLLRRLQWLLAC